MAQSIKLGDDLMKIVRRESELQSRSIAGQIAHWVRIGRAIEKSGNFNHARITAALAGDIETTNLTDGRSLLFELTVFENLQLAARRLETAGQMLRLIGRGEVSLRRVGELVERFDLGAKLGELAGALSHGEQRRLEIAVALAARPLVFGRNGVGKTTLMKAVAGWVEPSGGAIALDGQSFTACRQIASAVTGSALCQRIGGSFRDFRWKKISGSA